MGLLDFPGGICSFTTSPLPASLRGWLNFVPFFYLLSIVTKEDSSASAEHEESVC